MGSISTKIGARAAIDIGSNTILLTVVDQEGVVLFDEPRIVCLGKGLGDSGLFLPDRMKASEEVLIGFIRTAKSFGVEAQDIFVAATSAARRASNASEWFGQLTEKYKILPTIISGEEEAALTWSGGISDLPSEQGPYMLIDLGGGSTEVIQGMPSLVTSRLSLETGSVRLTEAYDLHEANVSPQKIEDAMGALRHLIAQVPSTNQPHTIVGVAGTVTSFSAMKLKLKAYDATRVHGSTLSISELDAFAHSLADNSPSGRRELCPLSPARAQYLLAGALILKSLIQHMGGTELVVSNRGLRFGLLSTQRGSTDAC
jgi:exopolyphosphatase/guanosine-5'-triphosphate,3'-diphosphate pyrophosphatase